MLQRRGVLVATAAATLAPLASGAMAGGRTTLPLVTTYVAGVAYQADPQLLAELRRGQPLTLRRRPDSRFDPRTVDVLSGERRLGSLPGTDARIIASLLDAGLEVRALVREARVGGSRPRITCDLVLAVTV